MKSNDYYKFIHNENNNDSNLTLDFFSDFYIFYLLAQEKGIKYKKFILKPNIQKDLKETVYKKR